VTMLKWLMVVLVMMMAVGPLPPMITMAATNSAPWTDAGLYCDFEDDSCNWDWSGFVVHSATEINASLWTSVDPTQISGPIYDGDGNTEGTALFHHFNPSIYHSFIQSILSGTIYV